MAAVVRRARVCPLTAQLFDRNCHQCLLQFAAQGVALLKRPHQLYVGLTAQVQRSLFFVPTGSDVSLYYPKLFTLWAALSPHNRFLQLTPATKHVSETRAHVSSPAPVPISQEKTHTTLKVRLAPKKNLRFRYGKGASVAPS